MSRYVASSKSPKYCSIRSRRTSLAVRVIEVPLQYRLSGVFAVVLVVMPCPGVGMKVSQACLRSYAPLPRTLHEPELHQERLDPSLPPPGASRSTLRASWIFYCRHDYLPPSRRA
jgi:hypothetical protein